MLKQMRRIAAKVVELGGFLCIDMESYRHKDIIIELYRRLKLEYRDYPHIGIVLQAYLKDTDQDLADLLAWARAAEHADFRPAGKGRLLGLRDASRPSRTAGRSRSGRSRPRAMPPLNASRG